KNELLDAKKQAVHKWARYDIKTDYKYGVVFGPYNGISAGPEYLYKSYSINKTWWNRIDLSDRFDTTFMEVGEVGYEKSVINEYSDTIYRYVKQSDGGMKCTGVGESQIVSSSQSKGKYNSSVESTNEFAYPKSGVKDGYWYEYIGLSK
ncbi:hypothetical protein HMPREF0072_0286, partial [Anaerococcus lactolyticus ATCC 51172]